MNEAKRYSAESGDVIVLTHPGKLTKDGREQIRAELKAAFGDSARIVLLQEGLTLDVVNRGIGL